MKLKTCTKCHKEKPISEFGKDKHYKDGIKSICRACVNEYNRSYYHQDIYEAEKEATNAIGGIKIYILNHPKKGEAKYNIVNTVTEKTFCTNEKEQFINYLREI